MCSTSAPTPANPATRRLACSCRARAWTNAAAIAKAAAARVKVGDPNDAATTIGPVVSAQQFERIQGLIERGIEEGATLQCGGPGRPDGLNAGFYVKPTVFSHVDNDMTIAREGDLRPGAVPHRLRGRRRCGAHRQRHELRSVRLRLRPERPGAGRGAAHSHRKRPLERRARGPERRRSAATSSPETAASGGATASRSSSKSRPSWATALKPTEARPP